MHRTRILILPLALLWSCALPQAEGDPPAQDALQSTDTVNTTQLPVTAVGGANEVSDRAEERVAELASSLRPFEDPLPSRQALESLFDRPVDVLLRLATAEDSDLLLRSNALRELGLFPESEEAVSHLLEVAIDKTAVGTDRVGAINGLAFPDVLNESRVTGLLSLLEDSDSMIQAASVRLLARWPEAQPRVIELADDPTSNVDVRRLAALALKQAREEPPKR